MHHATFPHKYDNPPAHSFEVPPKGELAELLRKEFPEAWFNEEFQEWWVDWDETQFPEQGRRLDAFATVHDLEIGHRYPSVKK